MVISSETSFFVTVLPSVNKLYVCTFFRVIKTVLFKDLLKGNSVKQLILTATLEKHKNTCMMVFGLPKIIIRG